MTYSIFYKQLAIHYRQHSAYMQYMQYLMVKKYLCMDFLVKRRSNCYFIVCVGHIHVMMASALYINMERHLHCTFKYFILFLLLNCFFLPEDTDGDLCQRMDMMEIAQNFPNSQCHMPDVCNKCTMILFQLLKNGNIIFFSGGGAFIAILMYDQVKWVNRQIGK